MVLVSARVLTLRRGPFGCLAWVICLPRPRVFFTAPPIFFESRRTHLKHPTPPKPGRCPILRIQPPLYCSSGPDAVLKPFNGMIPAYEALDNPPFRQRIHVSQAL